MNLEDDNICDALIDYLGIKRMFLILKALDEIYKTTGYGSIEICIRDRRIEFISKNISEDTRHI